MSSVKTQFNKKTSKIPGKVSKWRKSNQNCQPVEANNTEGCLIKNTNV